MSINLRYCLQDLLEPASQRQSNSSKKNVPVSRLLMASPSRFEMRTYRELLKLVKDGRSGTSSGLRS